MKRQMFRERECIHREEGADGDFYNGVFYLQALQRLRVDDAVKMAGKVTSFSGLMRRRSLFGCVMSVQRSSA